MFIFVQKINFYSSPLSWNITKILQTCGYYGYAWLRHQPVENSVKLMLICKQKINLVPQFILQILHFWPRIFWGITPEQEFCQTRGLGWKVKIKRTFIIQWFWKRKWQNVQKNVKYPILGNFLPKFGQKLIFHKYRTQSLFSIYSSLTACKKSEKKLMSQFSEKL